MACSWIQKRGGTEQVLTSAHGLMDNHYFVWRKNAQEIHKKYQEEGSHWLAKKCSGWPGKWCFPWVKHLPLIPCVLEGPRCLRRESCPPSVSQWYWGCCTFHADWKIMTFFFWGGAISDVISTWVGHSYLKVGGPQLYKGHIPLGSSLTDPGTAPLFILGSLPFESLCSSLVTQPLNVEVIWLSSDLAFI